MSQQVAIQENFGLGGINFPASRTITGDEVHSVIVDVAAAKPGVLTTRTDNDTGTLTMETGHGITTGALLDIYWEGGARRRVTVGTVSGLSVPFGASAVGAGDNLPVADTVIAAMVPIERQFPLINADLQLIAVKCDYTSQFTFMEADGTTEDYAISLEPDPVDSIKVSSWDADKGANPLTGTAIAEVWLSHADITASHTMYAAFMST